MTSALPPTAGVSLLRVNARRRRHLDAQQVEPLAAEASRPPLTRVGASEAAKYKRHGLAILVLAYCGWRWSELAALRTAPSAPPAAGRRSGAAGVLMQRMQSR